MRVVDCSPFTVGPLKHLATGGRRRAAMGPFEAHATAPVRSEFMLLELHNNMLSCNNTQLLFKIDAFTA